MVLVSLLRREIDGTNLSQPMSEILPNNLAALTAKIAGVLALKPQCFITHPSELYSLKTMTLEELRAFGEKHGWRTVRRVGGRQIEFYPDATARLR